MADSLVVVNSPTFDDWRAKQRPLGPRIPIAAGTLVPKGAVMVFGDPEFGDHWFVPKPEPDWRHIFRGGGE